jgi:hypothetical protein
MVSYDEDCWCVVIKYDDPRGGTWRGPSETKAAAEARFSRERARARGVVSLEPATIHRQSWTRTAD